MAIHLRCLGVLSRNHWLLLLLIMTLFVFSSEARAASTENECEPPESGLPEELATALAKEYDATIQKEILKQQGWSPELRTHQVVLVANTQPALWTNRG